MNEKLKEKVKESLTSVFPITAIVLLLCITVAPVPTDTLLLFFVGAIMLIVGMGLFTLGAETAMTQMGERVGAHVTGTKKLFLIILVSFLIGVIVTNAEPDLQVLAQQIPGIPNSVLIGAVSIGVGMFLVIAILRIIFKVKLSYMLIFFYGVLFLMTLFVPKEFLAIAFDSGGVTTGPMTVPFIMALGVGIASVRGNKESESDSFGLIALCSIGPILTVLILGLIYSPTGGSYTLAEIPTLASSQDLIKVFVEAFPIYLEEVGLAILPIVLFFMVYNVVALKLPKNELIKICVGILYTFLGLTLFLTGVNVGFLPVGNYLGGELASLSYNWILIPIGMVIGYFIVVAEPAVVVLNKQVNEITDGAIPERAMHASLSIGVAVSIGLAMFRILNGIPLLYFLVPGYLLALFLTFKVPEIFTSIAFDSGGVASGAMTATFLLPFAIGASQVLGGDIMVDAFGIIALVAMTPLITIQLLGLLYKLKLEHMPKVKEDAIGEEDIIEFEEA